MYVYLRSEPQLWTVGYYDAKQKWIAESDHSSSDDAAERVAWLNGDGDAFPISRSELDSLRFRLKEANELVEPLTRENDRLRALLAERNTQIAVLQTRVAELEMLLSASDNSKPKKALKLIKKAHDHTAKLQADKIMLADAAHHAQIKKVAQIADLKAELAAKDSRIAELEAAHDARGLGALALAESRGQVIATLIDERILLGRRIFELEQQLAATLATIERAAWCDSCNMPNEHCRESHGALYAEGCAP